MSRLKEKSLFNIESAKLLIDNNLYCSSVHCSYYSCFQLLKFAIKDFFGIDYDTLSSQIRTSNKNTHQYIIAFVRDEIENNVGQFEARVFKRKITDLKQFREEADYENIEVDIEQGNKAYQLAGEIRLFLSQTFHL